MKPSTMKEHSKKEFISPTAKVCAKDGNEDEIYWLSLLWPIDLQHEFLIS